MSFHFRYGGRDMKCFLTGLMKYKDLTQFLPDIIFDSLAIAGRDTVAEK